MASLSPWQRWALTTLAERGEHIPAAYAMRDGCKGLERRGLAERVEGSVGRYRLTDAGRAEHERRTRRTA